MLAAARRLARHPHQLHHPLHPVSHPGALFPGRVQVGRQVQRAALVVWQSVYLAPCLALLLPLPSALAVRCTVCRLPLWQPHCWRSTARRQRRWLLATARGSGRAPWARRLPGGLARGTLKHHSTNRTTPCWLLTAR